MRFMSWIAIFCLQIGIFTCSMGIDVCQASDGASYVTNSQSDGAHDDLPAGSTCIAHAAHVFVGLPAHQDSQSDAHIAKIRVFVSLALPDILHAIEHPPKLSYS